MSDNHVHLKVLPTGKAHISYSELREWKECAWRHYLNHIKGLRTSDESFALSFGKAIHSSCENYLKTREMNPNIAIDYMKVEYERNSQLQDFIKVPFEDCVAQIERILSHIPSYMEKTFTGWLYEAAEYELYEPIGDYDGTYFKGFIDGIIKVPGKKAGTYVYWIIDWKTSNTGWYSSKRRDVLTQNQLVLYKHYWSRKLGVKYKDVKIAFIILTRDLRSKRVIEHFTFSAGDKRISEAVDQLGRMINSMNVGRPRKNRDACKYCRYSNTEHCS